MICMILIQEHRHNHQDRIMNIPLHQEHSYNDRMNMTRMMIDPTLIVIHRENMADRPLKLPTMQISLYRMPCIQMHLLSYMYQHHMVYMKKHYHYLENILQDNRRMIIIHHDQQIFLWYTDCMIVDQSHFVRFLSYKECMKIEMRHY